jgi:IS30 family transposase
MILIDQRPPEVATPLTPGHFEGDLIVGAGNRSAVGVLGTHYPLNHALPAPAKRRHSRARGL